MIRFLILLGFALMFLSIHFQGQLNKYINMRYAYLSISAIVILLFLCIIELIRMDRLEKAAKKKAEAIELQRAEGHICKENHEHIHSHVHDHEGSVHLHDDFGHTHESSSKWKRAIGYLILAFPIFTGIFLPVSTLDSSFVKAKGFSFPSMELSLSEQNPGVHQFLKPDSSVFFGKQGYNEFKSKELEQFINLSTISLDDESYMKGMEVIYNYPGKFMGRTISFDGFAYKGEQVDGDHYFIFRFGFIHCAADSGVFGMLVHFPKGTNLNDDDWVHVTGKLTSELYQPFKQVIPVLNVTEFKKIAAPKDPYVYRLY
ncbi:TIGR03943 family protein [Cohnella sp. LGH]|uniref:TIGR03943 family putative permease subunit n=1 Tax=Cohnella sp. LGH TaxID=1619153 RepID=UPI001ADB51E7|nr:TIGR03943 family protein [Cohnella sp. LGH]QTH40170.1 TIGR03943 family protein [Cohnella sp. LGH]